MRAWRNLFLTVIGVMAVIFPAVNLLLLQNAPDEGRPYRVEINRLALQIEQEGFERLDLSQCEYVYHVEPYGDDDDDFYDSESDHAIRTINGNLYRFDYVFENSTTNTSMIVFVNTVFIFLSLLVLGLLLYVRAKILRPFDELTKIPYELSKGNLTAPDRKSVV